MLAPAHPDKSDPGYRDKKEQYRKDREELRRHPERWGFVGGAETPELFELEDETQE